MSVDPGLTEQQEALLLKQATDEAVAYLDNLYAQVYFQKLAEYGHVPSDLEEAAAMLKVGYDLAALAQEEQADGGPGLYKIAALSLNSLTGDDVVQSIQQDEAETMEIAKAAASDPDIYAAALHLRALAALSNQL